MMKPFYIAFKVFLFDINCKIGCTIPILKFNNDTNHWNSFSGLSLRLVNINAICAKWNGNVQLDIMSDSLDNVYRFILAWLVVVDK